MLTKNDAKQLTAGNFARIDFSVNNDLSTRRFLFNGFGHFQAKPFTIPVKRFRLMMTIIANSWSQSFSQVATESPLDFSTLFILVLQVRFETTMEIESRAAVLQDLRIQSFDTIRFASYRTACKLRYVQKATNRKSSIFCALPRESYC
jgi:EF hand